MGRTRQVGAGKVRLHKSQDGQGKAGEIGRVRPLVPSTIQPLFLADCSHRLIVANT
jgi:hypothetical protein